MISNFSSISSHEKINTLQSAVKEQLETILSSIPNVPHEDVPIGKDENSNVEISKSGDLGYTYGEYIYSYQDSIGNQQKETGVFSLSLVGPKQWGKSGANLEFVGTVKLLADHTWDILERNEKFDF